MSEKESGPPEARRQSLTYPRHVTAWPRVRGSIEAWDGGPLAHVRDGDRIEINMPENRLQLLISDQELQQRQKTAPVRPDHPAPGLLKAYRQNVCGADQGAVWSEHNHIKDRKEE